MARWKQNEPRQTPNPYWIVRVAGTDTDPCEAEIVAVVVVVTSVVAITTVTDVAPAGTVMFD